MQSAFPFRSNVSKAFPFPFLFKARRTKGERKDSLVLIVTQLHLKVTPQFLNQKDNIIIIIHRVFSFGGDEFKRITWSSMPRTGLIFAKWCSQFFISTLVSNAIKAFPQKSIQVRKVVLLLLWKNRQICSFIKSHWKFKSEDKYPRTNIRVWFRAKWRILFTYLHGRSNLESELRIYFRTGFYFTMSKIPFDNRFSDLNPQFLEIRQW